MTAVPEIPEAAVAAAAREYHDHVCAYAFCKQYPTPGGVYWKATEAILAAAAPEIARAAKVKALRDLAGDFPSVSQRVHVQALINARADEIEAQS